MPAKFMHHLQFIVQLANTYYQKIFVTDDGSYLFRSYMKCCTDFITIGSIIRCMRRLEELLRQMCQAAKVIGNTELENKFADGITKLKRDIVFAASLYL